MQRAAFTIYLSILIVSILMFGAMHTYVYTLMTLGVLTATALVFVKNIKKNHRTASYRVRFPGTGIHMLFFGLLIFLFFQIIPLPDSVLSLLSPEAAVVAEKSLPASIVVNQPEAQKHWHTLASRTCVDHPVCGLWIIFLWSNPGTEFKEAN